MPNNPSNSSTKLTGLPRLVGEPVAYVSSNPVEYALINKSFNAKRTYLSRLNQVARLFQFSNYSEVPWHLLRHEHVQFVVNSLKNRRLAVTTINTTLSALRGVAREAFNLGQLSGEDVTRINRIRFSNGPRFVAAKRVTSHDIKALTKACVDSENASGIRDLAVIGLMYVCGLRRSEVAGLRVADFNPKTGTVSISGANKNKRTCWPDPGTHDALLDWLTLRGAGSFDERSPLFTSLRKGGRITSQPISDQSIYNLVTKRWKQAGCPPCTPADFRRSFVTNLLDKNVDIGLAQSLAGHLHPATTLRYDRRSRTDVRPSIPFSTLPYTSRLDQENP